MTTTHKEKSERHDLDETIRLNSANSVASSIPNRSFISFIESDHFFQSEADKTYFSEKIEEIERIHKEEVMDLKNFYEQKISNLRELTEKELKMRAEEVEREKDQSENRSIANSRSSRRMDGYKTPARVGYEGNNMQLNLK